MLEPLVDRRTPATRSIVLVDPKTYSAWRRAQDAATRRWIEAHDFEPKGNRVLMIPAVRGPAFALFGTSDSGPWPWAALAERLPPGRYRFATEVSKDIATDVAIGWALAAYDDRRHKTTPRAALRELVWPREADRAEAVRVVRATTTARDLINAPAHDLGPSELGDAARAIGDAYGAVTRVIGGARLAREYPALHAVGRGSARGPLMVDMRFGGDRGLPRVTIIGKGVCFDSGGLDLKDANGMLRMKKDMAGAAIAIGLAGLVADAALPVALRVLLPLCENLPGPNAMRPMDVLRTRKGVTVEVSNTDAEGRLILADALAEADRETPDLLIDVATLTGSSRIALGSDISAYFTNDRTISDELMNAAQKTRDHAWRLPLHKGYRRLLESRVADLKNAPSTHLGGAITAALFLAEFVSKTERWLHLDIYGWIDTARPGRPMGGEPTGMLALWALLKNRYPIAASKSGAPRVEKGPHSALKKRKNASQATKNVKMQRRAKRAPK